MKYTVLDTVQIKSLLAEHPDWTLSDDKVSVSRQFKFKNFIQAMDFMNTVAQHAEKINHHPNWSNVYNRVDVILTTHDKKSLTDLDADMMSFMDSAFFLQG